MKLFRFERPARVNFLLDYGHGRFVDAWTLVHIASGLTIGTIGVLFAIDYTQLLVSTLILLFLYELFEAWVGVVEDVENALSDIFFGFGATCCVVWTLSYTNLEAIYVFVLVITSIAFACIGLSIGWQRHLKKLAEKKIQSCTAFPKNAYREARYSA